MSLFHGVFLHCSSFLPPTGRSEVSKQRAGGCSAFCLKAFVLAQGLKDRRCRVETKQLTENTAANKDERESDGDYLSAGRRVIYVQSIEKKGRVHRCRE